MRIVQKVLQPNLNTLFNTCRIFLLSFALEAASFDNRKTEQQNPDLRRFKVTKGKNIGCNLKYEKSQP